MATIVERGMNAGRQANDGDSASLGEQLAAIIAGLPEDHLTLGELLEVFGDEGLLLLTMLLTLVFLIPVSIPGVSTVFGAAILLVGISRLVRRPLWLPARLRERPCRSTGSGRGWPGAWCGCGDWSGSAGRTGCARWSMAAYRTCATTWRSSWRRCC
jgi:hypothetical protein